MRIIKDRVNPGKEGSLTAQQRESNGEQWFGRLLRNGANVHLESHLSLKHHGCRASSFVFHSEGHGRAHAVG